LLDRARVPLHIAHAVTPEVVAVIIDLREKYPTWGPKKLDAYLKREKPKMQRPSRSTMANILKRNDLVKERTPRRRTPQATFPLALATQANSIWCADFKGKFRVARRYCHPLTITDAWSRYILRSDPLQGETTVASREVFAPAASKPVGASQCVTKP